MPEENFEEQARRKAEEFGMEPNADVWLRVQAAIRPERRRRVLWWWLLPLCVAGVAGGLLLNRSGKMPERASSVALRAHEKGKKVSSDEKPVTAKAKRPAENINGEVIEQEIVKKSDKNVDSHVEKLGIKMEAGKEWKNQYPGNEKERVVQREDDRDAELKRLPFDTIINVTKRNDETDFLVKENASALHDDSINKQAPIIADSVDKSNNKTPAIAFAGKDSNSVKPGINKEVEQKKKTDKRKWQTGIVAEVGLTSWGKDLLTKEAKSAGYYNVVPSASSTSIDSLLAVTSGSQRTKNGVDAGIGFTVRKEVGHHFYVSGQLGYRYQQYQVYNLRTSASTFQNFTADYLVNKNSYHNHFISLYSGAGRLLVSGLQHALSVEAGLDNSLLMINGRQNIRQTALDPRGGSNFTKADFYRWQPQLFLSLPFDWHAAGKVRVAVSPFARLGLHTYQKNGAGYGSNHLMSAGVQAVYFFR